MGAIKGLLYDASADMWGVGVIIYALLVGYPPFYAHTPHGVYIKVTKGNYAFKDTEWGSISQNAQDLIRLCLKHESEERLTAAHAREHHWCTDHNEQNSKPHVGAMEKMSESYFVRLAEFQRLCRVRPGAKRRHSEDY